MMRSGVAEQPERTSPFLRPIPFLTGNLLDIIKPGKTLRSVIVVLLLLILWKLRKIDGRLKERFPTEEEEDYEWSQKDPMGHWEAHKDDKK